MASAAAVASHAWRAAPFTYRKAFVRALAPSFAADALRAAGPAVVINQAVAAAQHAAYVAALRRLIPEVVELPPADGCPDSVFIEDTAVVLGGTALITRPGDASRRAECEGVAEALAVAGLRVVPTPATAQLDGGDVLFTGREIFVGLSDRTDRGGYEAVRNAFPGIPCSPIALPGGPFDGSIRPRFRRQIRSAERLAADAALKARREADAAASAAAAGGKKGAGAPAAPAAAAPSLESKGGRPHVHTPDGSCCNTGPTDLGSDADGPLFHALHLKSLVTMAGLDVVALADTPEGLAVAEMMQARQKAHRRGRPLEFLVLPPPEYHAANVVLANDGLLVRSASECPESVALLRRLGHAHVIEVDASEIAKADGALSCCSLLLH